MKFLFPDIADVKLLNEMNNFVQNRMNSLLIVNNYQWREYFVPELLHIIISYCQLQYNPSTRPFRFYLICKKSHWMTEFSVQQWFLHFLIQMTTEASWCGFSAIHVVFEFVGIACISCSGQYAGRTIATFLSVFWTFKYSPVTWRTLKFVDIVIDFSDRLKYVTLMDIFPCSLWFDYHRQINNFMM